MDGLFLENSFIIFLLLSFESSSSSINSKSWNVWFNILFIRFFRKCSWLYEGTIILTFGFSSVCW